MWLRLARAGAHRAVGESAPGSGGCHGDLPPWCVLVTDPSIEDPEWDLESAGPPWRGRLMRLGARIGAKEIGVTLYEMDAGGAISPYHVHHGNEEMLIVVSGRPLLRTPTGSRRLEPGAAVAFPRGPEGAHRVSNPGEEPARVLIFSTMHFPEVAEHLDTGTVMAMTGPADGKTFPGASDGSFMELYFKAMEAALERDVASDDASPSH
jgi:uncharacterized cupin superfamily protein